MNTSLGSVKFCHARRGRLAQLAERGHRGHGFTDGGVSVIGDRTQYRRYPWRDKAAVYLRKYRFQAKFWLLDQWHKRR